MRILLIDDTPQILNALSRMLRKEGHYVCTACDGCEGVQELSQNPNYDLIITDLKMPVWDGYKLAFEAKRITNIPILLHTGNPFAKKTIHIAKVIAKGDWYEIKKFIATIKAGNVQEHDSH